MGKKIMESVGAVMVMLGLGMADSDALWIPVAVIAIGAILFRKGEQR